jgi:hypothetical protein
MTDILDTYDRIPLGVSTCLARCGSGLDISDSVVGVHVTLHGDVTALGGIV